MKASLLSTVVIGSLIFRNTHRINSLFPYKDRLNRSLKSKVVYKASCWDCDDFYIGKTKRRLHDRKNEHFKALWKNGQTSAIADHITSTGHNIKWDHFEILATGRSVQHRKLSPTANDPQTGNDPQIGPQMIPPENEEWHGVWFPGFFKIFYFIFVFIYFHH